MQQPSRKPSAEWPDELGVKTAQCIQAALPRTIVILFGSRARGDHRPNSDVDILIIIPDDDSPNWVEAQARQEMMRFRQHNGMELECDIMVMTEKQFQRNRLAKQHIAGQADTYGVIMSGERLEYRYNHEDEYEDEYPNHRRGRKAMPTETELLSRITVRPDVFGGKPIIRDMRIAVEHVLAMLAAGDPPEEVLREYTFLEPEDIQACLLFAHRSLAGEQVHERTPVRQAE